MGFQSYPQKDRHLLRRLFLQLCIGMAVVIALVTIIFVMAGLPTFSDGSPIQRTMWKNNAKHRYEWPLPANSLLGKFEKAAVTCDHGFCNEIGRDILIKGGNAIDSSIASLFCLGVTNPQSSGIGGGFIMTVYNRTLGKCLALDARETAPAKAVEDMFKGNSNGSKYGWNAIATPGELHGYRFAWENWGSGLVSWKELIQPSIDLARNGVPVSEYLAYVLEKKEWHFNLTTPNMDDWINPETKRVWKFGDIIKRNKLADTLERIANSEDPIKDFYEGELAEIMVDEIQKAGGIMSKEDLKNYRPKLYETPLIRSRFYENLTMCGPPPPSSFAITQNIISVMTSKFYNYTGNGAPADGVYSDTYFYHALIEAQKFAYAKRTLMGDVDFEEGSKLLAENMTTAEYNRYIAEIIPDFAQDTSFYGLNDTATKEDHGTSHVSVLDQFGNGVSATSTVNRWMGAGVQSPALGIVWNDEMDDFSTPGQDNGFGFAPSPENFIKPGKRPMSSMSPMVIYDEETLDVKMVIGASGGSKIISAVAKPVIRVLCFNETIKQAIDAPIFHNQYTPDVTQYEDNMPLELIHDLENKFGQKFKPTGGFEGIVQGIVVGNDGKIYANGDYRRKTQQHPEGF
uniref:Gamma-glutamyltranspeptidase 1 n=2 Tax=Bursaphelenchus xylophilus TaxID=6326 RepID=A0A1I7RTA5_BURXY